MKKGKYLIERVALRLRIKEVIILAVSITCSVYTASAATYYVDFAAGSDTNSGLSTAAAFRTIPGTYNTAGGAYLHTSWGNASTTAGGAFTQKNRVPSNTTFKLKGGTTHNSANGGFIWIASNSSDFYTTTESGLVFESTGAWGTGPAILDGTGITARIALFLCQVDGVTLRGFKVQNSPTDGIEFKEKAGTGGPLNNIVLDSMTLYGNGTSYATDLAGSGEGNVNFRYVNNLTVTNCMIEGNHQFINGFLCGDNYKAVVNGTFTNCTVQNVKGDLVDNDAGIGFKNLNSQVTFIGCTSSNNLKGWDNGEQSGQARTILVKVINCTAQHNTWGINFNTLAGIYGAPVNYYVINCIITDNAGNGIRAYASPWNLHIVHSTFLNNGSSLGGTGEPRYNCSNVQMSPNTITDPDVINVHLYNNIFGKTAPHVSGYGYTTDAPCFTSGYFASANTFTVDCDYNAYNQNGTELFMQWAGMSASPAASAAFSYGTNGPGHASGDWYNFYGNDATVPAAGTGHYHCDAHSIGSGCAATTAITPDGSYYPSTYKNGADLSGRSWYISEMGTDRNGNTRTSWSMGAYESTGAAPPQVLNLRVIP